MRRAVQRMLLFMHWIVRQLSDPSMSASSNLTLQSSNNLGCYIGGSQSVLHTRGSSNTRKARACT